MGSSREPENDADLTIRRPSGAGPAPEPTARRSGEATLHSPPDAAMLDKAAQDGAGREPGAPRRPAPAVRWATQEVNVEAVPLAEPDAGERYEALAILGEGGMGEVRLCRDRRIGRDVAMKVIRPDQWGLPDVRARFEREARVQGQLEHPSVVPVYDLGLGPNGEAYFTMKRVRGLTLQEIIEGLQEQNDAIAREYSTRKLLTAFSSVCLAVAFAHARGVLHRDLKPANVMLGAYGEVHVLDWGLAKIAGAPEVAPHERVDPGAGWEHRTQVGDVMGSPGYMAPEQVRGEVDALDVTADVYALGSILFELVTLQPLHPRQGVRGVLDSTLRGADARASVRAPERNVPLELEAICVRATALAPGDRFASARELHDAVERFLDGDRDLARRRELAAAYAAAAARAADKVALGGDEGQRARELAMREVSSALALDPSHAGALSTLVRLLLDAPADVPAEARAEFEASKLEVDRTGRRTTVAGYLVWVAFLPLVALILGVRSAPAFAALAGLIAAVVAASWWSARSLLGPRARFGIYTLASLAIASASLIMGPFILVPTLVALHTLGYFLYGGRSFRPYALAIALLAVAAPWGLQELGVLPRSYVFHDGVLEVLPQMTDLPATGTRLFLLLASCALVAGPALMMARVRDEMAQMEKRLFLHAWNLKHLVPDAARAAAVVPSRRGRDSGEVSRASAERGGAPSVRGRP